jgi:signal transduction histidine kinase
MKDKRQNSIALLLFIISASILFSLTIYTSLMMESVSSFLKDDIKERLLSVSRLAATLATPEELAELDSPGDIDTPLFHELRERLVTFGEENNVIFVYFMRLNEDDLYQFIIDNDTSEETVNLASEPVEREPGPDSAYRGVAATSDLENYSIGFEGYLSSFAPVFDRAGNVVAVAGVDISDEQILTMSRHTRNLIIMLIISVVLVVASGLINIFLQVRRERRLSANLKQQQLMSEISQSLISDKPLTTLIEDALRRSGEFLGVSRCVIVVTGNGSGGAEDGAIEDDGAGAAFDGGKASATGSVDGAEAGAADAAATEPPPLAYLWSSTNDHRSIPIFSELDQVFYDMFPSTTPETGTVAPFYCNDVDAESDVRRAAFMKFGLKAFIMAPIYVEATLWGILSIESCDGQRQWNDNDAQLVGMVSSAIAGAVARDLIERQRGTALKHAVMASRAKGDFLSNMSHEMRTPMNAIIGMSTIGLSATEIERKDYCLNRIGDASSHLLAIINDVLDMSKIEADKLELSYVSFEFAQMVDKAINVIGFRAEERHQNLIVTIDENIPKHIITDDQRLAQVIANLLSNAIKFTPEEGTIEVIAHLVDSEDGLFTIQIDVRDTGIGISAEQQERLFTSFEQADTGTSRKFGGTGLGLAISKRIVELMSGRIWLESELGKGSTFSFTLKARQGKDKDYSYLPVGVDWANVRILAVDDAEETREYFHQTATKLGIACNAASDGEEALASIARTGGYDIYFIDWKMPDMDGIELSRRIRSQFGSEPIIVITSSAEWSEIREEALGAGVSRFIQKPLSMSSIADCLNELFDFSAIQQPELVTDEFPDFSSHRILLAEDIEVNREIVLALLEPTGIQIDCAVDGKEALERFCEDPARYDLIFMDIQMPEMDGCETTQKIRAMSDPHAQSIPIVAMTANVFREDVESCLAAGMNDHIGKPLDLPGVVAILRKWL